MEEVVKERRDLSFMISDYNWLKDHNFILNGQTFEEYIAEIERLTILYNGDKKKKIPDEKGSPDFANWQLSLEPGSLPARIIELFRRYKYDQENYGEGVTLYNPNYVPWKG